MLRSMFSAISGLRAHQTKMDVVGNNIANVNTVGYKSQTTVFEDTLSQVLRNGSAPTADGAGTNPAQVGLGVKLAATATNWTQGSTQNTGRSTDFMISGDGFFMTKAGTETTFTRAGSFDFDGVGNLVTPDGAILQGWMATAAGTIDTNGTPGNLTIPYGQVMAPVKTTNGAVAGNLSAAATSTDAPIQSPITMYDTLGNEHSVKYVVSKDASPATTWTLKLMEGATQLGANVSLDFNAAGVLTTPASKTASVTTPWGAVAIDLAKVTQYGGDSSVTATKPVGSGSALGTLQSFILGNDGTITGVYSNDLKMPIGQLALATFTNPSGLTKAGNSSYRVGTNSGNPLVGTAGTGGRGTLSAGSLEMSNVDLSEEFTGLIVAQRGFQANTKVITASDEILQDLVNLKR